ncbi:hypothetical protein [Burkholderia multivorans]|uniref:hypothetical protein n=1 Tax=Burkholderia multivorans TaxID=87883 RepID=UPI0020A1BE46|nr:hypothetical protein [Burkholderia multivorans]MCO8593308.1 hypothetical protein [Burkholderia multivorans]MCO8631903.1 hypothetical protein [Burkholderia multivorans]MCO8648570.1 hypothetical protein [Burkholderia multivorans]
MMAILPCASEVPAVVGRDDHGARSQRNKERIGTVLRDCFAGALSDLDGPQCLDRAFICPVAVIET